MAFEDVAMTKEEIERICSDEYVKHIKDRYTGYSEVYYSNGKLIKQKYFYPDFLDLYVTVEHGVHEENNIDGILPDILQDTQVFLSCRKVKSKYKKVLTSGNMFIYYKEKNRIKPKESRMGTVVFPSHSHSGISWDVDWQEYIDKLNQLPQEMFPLLICLYYYDVQKGVHNIFYENGFKVTTAGHRKDPKFVERFYKILSSVKYSTSNMIMSSTFYAVDFEIPFYFYGADKGIRGIGSPIQHSKLEQNSSERFREIQNHFSEFKKNVSEEDKKIIYYITGKSESEVLASPYLAQFRENKVDVLLLTDHIDTFIVQALTTYKDANLKSITNDDIQLKEKTEEEKKKEEETKKDFKDLLELTKNII